MKKTNFLKLSIIALILVTAETAFGQGFTALTNEMVDKIKPVIGIACALAFIGGIFFAFQGEEGAGKAKWAFGAVAIGLILYFGLAGMVAAVQRLLGI